MRIEGRASHLAPIRKPKPKQVGDPNIRAFFLHPHISPDLRAQFLIYHSSKSMGLGATKNKPCSHTARGHFDKDANIESPLDPFLGVKNPTGILLSEREMVSDKGFNQLSLSPEVGIHSLVCMNRIKFVQHIMILAHSRGVRYNTPPER